jgi:hypothetical protein
MKELDVWFLTAFVIFIIVMVNLQYGREVKPTICEANNLSTYVGLKDPPEELKLGKCFKKKMTFTKYVNLRESLRYRR